MRNKYFLPANSHIQAGIQLRSNIDLNREINQNTSWNLLPATDFKGFFYKPAILKKKNDFSRLPGWHEESSLSAGNELADCTLCKLFSWFGKVERQGWVCEGDLDHRGQTETVVSGVV